MKKFFILATAAAVALASCSKVVMDENLDQDQEISFVTMNKTAATKANDKKGDHIQFYQDGEFEVLGLFTPSSWTEFKTGDYTSYMGKIEDDGTTTFIPIKRTEIVAEDAENNKPALYAWKSSTAYYWPKAGKLSFIGYYPSSVTAAKVVATGSPISNVDADKDTKGMSIEFTDYEVKGAITEQNSLRPTDKDDDKNDLMIASIYNQTSNNAGDRHDSDGKNLADGVAMIFNHLLAKVSFKAQLKDYTDGTQNLIYTQLGAQINSIEIQAIDNKATFNGSAWENPSNETKVNSGNFVNYDQITGTLPKVDEKLKTENTGLLVNTKSTEQGPEYYVLPQSLEDDSKVVVVNYTVYTTDGTNVIEAVSKKATVALNLMKNTTSNVEEWEINKKYIYTIIIDPFADEIYFDPAVVDWETETAEYEVKKDDE